MEQKEANKSVRYNDIIFRIGLALVAAHFIVAFGAKESLFQLFLMLDYWRSLLLSFLIASLLINLIYFATVKLDRRFDWKDDTIQRIGLQIIGGLMLPGVIAFLLAFIYFRLFGINIFNTRYLQFDFPVVMLMLLLLNIYYLTFYFFRQWQAATTLSDKEQKAKEVFVVQRGAKNIPLQTESICYFYHEGGVNFARTFEREDFVILQTLDEVQQVVNDKQFFRANRQTIINFTACQHFEPLPYGKLELFVTPPTKEPVIISQKRIRAFKNWMER